MAPQNISLWVSAGALSSPYYRFYTDSSGRQEFTDNTLDIGKDYTFRRLGEATAHPFYISDNGLKAASSDALLITGEGSPSQGISGNQSFRLEFTDSASANDQLKYYCSAHPSMQGIFRLIGEPNHSPTHLSISNLNFDENIAVGTEVGTLRSSDPNSDDAFTYSLVTGAGDGDNDSFLIDTDQLRILESPDFEIKSSYSVRLRTTDSGNLSLEKSFTLTVNDLDDTTILKPLPAQVTKTSQVSTPGPVPTATTQEPIFTPEAEPNRLNEPESYDGLIESVRGKGKLKGTSVTDAFTFDSFEPFIKKNADKIIGFDAQEGDTIAVSTIAFPALEGSSVINFVSTMSKKKLMQFSKENYDFVYFEKNGRLFFDGNGSEKKWGNSDEGGLVAILKGKPQLTAEDITLLA